MFWRGMRGWRGTEKKGFGSFNMYRAMDLLHFLKMVMSSNLARCGKTFFNRTYFLSELFNIWMVGKSRFTVAIQLNMRINSVLHTQL